MSTTIDAIGQQNNIFKVPKENKSFVIPYPATPSFKKRRQTNKQKSTCIYTKK